MFLLIDNYDSFTYNLRHFLGELGVEVEVVRNDVLTAEEAMAKKPEGIVISPGPCDPDRAGICLEVVRLAADRAPLLGVCLGHQCLGQAFGGTVVRAPAPMHGKVSAIAHDGSRLFDGIPSPFSATRYHSLTMARDDLPDCFDVTAESDDGVIQGLAHRSLPMFGVQFHPESIASEHGHALLQNFIDAARQERIAA
jgi:anthranilate synthase component II